MSAHLAGAVAFDWAGGEVVASLLWALVALSNKTRHTTGPAKDRRCTRLLLVLFTLIASMAFNKGKPSSWAGGS